MSIEERKSEREWWLHNIGRPNEKWGPFNSEDAGWRYLFGRESNPEERARHYEAGWHVLIDLPYPQL